MKAEEEVLKCTCVWANTGLTISDSVCVHNDDVQLQCWVRRYVLCLIVDDDTKLTVIQCPLIAHNKLHTAVPLQNVCSHFQIPLTWSLILPIPLTMFVPPPSHCSPWSTIFTWTTTMPLSQHDNDDHWHVSAVDEVLNSCILSFTVCVYYSSTALCSWHRDSAAPACQRAMGKLCFASLLGPTFWCVTTRYQLILLLFLLPSIHPWQSSTPSFIGCQNMFKCHQTKARCRMGVQNSQDCSHLALAWMYRWGGLEWDKKGASTGIVPGARAFFLWILWPLLVADQSWMSLVAYPHLCCTSGDEWSARTSIVPQEAHHLHIVHHLPSSVTYCVRTA